MAVSSGSTSPCAILSVSPNCGRSARIRWSPGIKDGFDKDPVFAAAIVEAGEDYKRVSPTPNEYDAFLAAISQNWSTQPAYRPEQIGRIVTPTAIIAGEYDEVVKREHTEEIARLMPGAKLLILPGVSHFAHRQNPELYNRELTGFLDSK